MERNTAITIETLPRFSTGSLRLTLPRIRMRTFLQIVGRILHARPEPAGERGLHLIDIEPAGDSSLGYLVNSIGLVDPPACDHASHPEGTPVKGFVAATSRRATEFIRNAAQGLAR